MLVECTATPKPLCLQELCTSAFTECLGEAPAFIAGAVRRVSCDHIPFLNPPGWRRLRWVAISSFPKSSQPSNENLSVDYWYCLRDLLFRLSFLVADLDNNTPFMTQLCRPQAGFIIYGVIVARHPTGFVSATVGDPWTVLQ